MSTISSFKAQMSRGGARPNQFRVEMTFPAFIGSAAAAGNAAQFLCKSATLPSSTIDDITAFYRGRPVHFAGERTFAPWTVSVFNDNDFLIRNVMETWSDRILNYDATNGTLAPNDYQVQMSVHQLDRNDEIVKTYTFYDVYPTNVGQIALDFEANNQIELFDVEFVYNYFIASDV
jgi:hypothetical protein